jgi:hypothetical protein
LAIAFGAIDFFIAITFWALDLLRGIGIGHFLGIIGVIVKIIVLVIIGLIP